MTILFLLQVKEVAKDRLYEPANQIVERVLIDWTTENDANVPRPANLGRTANRYRHMRPDDPTDLHFEVSFITYYQYKIYSN